MQSQTAVTLIRHGHTASNGGHVNPLMSGRADILLSEFGLHQVRRLAEFLSSEPPFDVVYTSPLRRAVDTARACIGGDAAKLQLCAGLQEIDCGCVDGLTIDSVRASYPELWAENLRQDNDSFCWPGGETYAQFRARSLEALRQICSAHRGQRVAIVTHAGAISQIVGSMHGLRAAAWERFRPGNTSLTEILWAGTSGRLITFDRQDHLRSRNSAGVPSSAHLHDG